MNLTEAAQQQLDCVLGPGEWLEIGLRTGGCSGATITLDKVAQRSTSELSTSETGNSSIQFADTTSKTYLEGGSLDYVQDGLSSSFVVSPPKGIQSCGCGSSIVIE